VCPHVEPNRNGFVDYCGAGLALKMAQHMLFGESEVLPSLVALAAIGTVADVMPLVGDNRVIVRNGLTIINERKKLSVGLKALLSVLELTMVSEQDIGFKIGPMLNAPGRIRADA